MQFQAISMQGNILSADLIRRVREEEEGLFQRPADFGLEKGLHLRDEINNAWGVLRARWRAFRQRLALLEEDESAVTRTRKDWMLHVFRELGYEMETGRAEIIQGKSYAISHRDVRLGGFPVHIAGFRQSLDRRAESSGPRLSPHGLVQEYLNNHENLYGLVSNGQYLRLLRNASLITRLSYVEFDLQRIMEEELFLEFSLLYRLLHSSRMPRRPEEGPECILEKYHLESLAAGSRIRDNLSGAVEHAIVRLANALLHHPANQALREDAARGQLTAPELYQYLLRLVYRVLFLLVIEERNLVWPGGGDEAARRRRDIYDEYYSVGRLARLVLRQVYVDPRAGDLWMSMQATFRLFESERYAAALGIPPLASGLFAPGSLGPLPGLQLDNAALLEVLGRLVTFRNAEGRDVRVNYADLNVEEFGSVYEGLLEYDAVYRETGTRQFFAFVQGSGRSSSGSHYTPEELVQPLIRHSLDYLIEERLTAPDPAAALLDLKLCDVACGSGHILLSAARRIALALARVRTGEDQPGAGPQREAVRDVIRHCIYGVDLNPLAVELCKVALWLEAHNPGEPLHFLDHHIRNGNAILGVARLEELEQGIPEEAFKKTLPYDDDEVMSNLRRRNKRERKERLVRKQLTTEAMLSVREDLGSLRDDIQAFSAMPEATPEDVAHKQERWQSLTSGRRWFRLKQLADLQLAPFFAERTAETIVCTDAEYMALHHGRQAIQTRASATAQAIAAEHCFFHWFLEFPEVFRQDGFDCILGNPPFLGGQKLSGTYGDAFLECIKYLYAPIGAVDLVTYFFRRIFGLINLGGFMSLISTNTIAQGRAREDGLDVIIRQGGVINHAVRSMRWPGQAAVEVALVTITRQRWKGPYILSGNKVRTITPYLDDAITIGNPYALKQNEGKSFQGSIVLGKGFILEPDQAKAMIAKDPRNKDVLFPYLNGDDLNNNPDQSPSRWVINFFDWAEERAQDYPDCYEIIERLVKPERQRWATNKYGSEIIGEYALRKPLPEKWWIYGEKRPALYRTIAPLDRVLVVAQVSKTVGFVFVPADQVISMMCIAFPIDDYFFITLLQNSLHKEWVYKYASALKSDIRYTPSDVFETFPFPDRVETLRQSPLEKIGQNYHEQRHQLMLGIFLGLTRTYNLFHSKLLPAPESAAQLSAQPSKDIERLYGKETAHLVRHLNESKEVACTLEQALAGIHRLRALHVEMDQAVLKAYGWQDISLRHDFYEMEYLPENDRVRYTIHPEARKEILHRLLKLNHQRYEEEIRQGLHKWKDVEAFYADKGLEIPAEVRARYARQAKPSPDRPRGAGRRKSAAEEALPVAAEPEAAYPSRPGAAAPDLFSAPALFIGEGSRVHLRAAGGREEKVHILRDARKSEYSGEYRQIGSTSRLAEALMGKAEGEMVSFGGVDYTILNVK